MKVRKLFVISLVLVTMLGLVAFAPSPFQEPTASPLTVEQVTQYAGIILSLGIAYIPGISTAYDKLDTKSKAGVMAILLGVVSLGIFGIACAGFAGNLNLGVTCDQTSAVSLLKLFITALIANQATFLLGVRPFKQASA